MIRKLKPIQARASMDEEEWKAKGQELKRYAE